MQLKSEIGLQLLIFVQSPFLGISLIVADLKGGVRSPLRKQQSEYFFRGTLNHFQNLLMNLLFIPSPPAADLLLAPIRALSSSSREKSPSNNSASALLSLLPVTIGLPQMSGPKNLSTQLSYPIGGGTSVL